MCRHVRIEPSSGSRMCQPLNVELPGDLEWGIVSVRWWLEAGLGRALKKRLRPRGGRGCRLS